MPSSPSQNPDEQPGLLKILASVFSGVLFGWFFSKLDTPAKDNGEPIHPKDNPRPETSLGALQIPVTPQIPPTPAQHYQPDRRKDNTPRWKKWTEIVAVSIAGGSPDCEWLCHGRHLEGRQSCEGRRTVC
jgi:hypothetical protein